VRKFSTFVSRHRKTDLKKKETLIKKREREKCVAAKGVKAFELATTTVEL